MYYFQAQSSESDDHNDSSWNPTHIGDGSAKQNDGNGGASSSAESSGHITRLASIDSFDSKWYLSICVVISQHLFFDFVERT